MKIRALTLGQELDYFHDNCQSLQSNLLALNKLKDLYETHGIEVEYVRYSAPPIDQTYRFPSNYSYSNIEDIAQLLDNCVSDRIMGIYSFCPILGDQKGKLTDEQLWFLNNLPSLLKTHPSMFSSVQVASFQNGLNFETLQHGISIIKNLAIPNPFQNVQFAITNSVPANTPFFPSAYSRGDHPSLSIALEAADELNKLLTMCSTAKYSLKDLQQKIRTRFEAIYDEITEIALSFCKEHQLTFNGIDISPAPYPTQEKSIGTSLELVGLSKFGGIGSTFSVGFLTQAIQSIDRPKIGFSGFMQPLLEDFTIAQRANEDLVDLSRLLLFSTQCGLGLDCIPIPGNVTHDALQLLLMDLAMISIRLKKPLTARLMPIPGKKSGDQTNFNFEYFTDSKILDLHATNSQNLDEFNKQNQHFQF